MNISFLYVTAPQHLSQNILLQNVRNNDSFIITVHLPPTHSSKDFCKMCITDCKTQSEICPETSEPYYHCYFL